MVNKGANLSPNKLNEKTESPFYLAYISVCSILFWFWVSCFYMRLSEVFGLLFSGDFGFYYST